MSLKRAVILAAMLAGAASLPAYAFKVEQATTDAAGNPRFSDPDQVPGTRASTDTGSGYSYYGQSRDDIQVDDRGLPRGLVPPRDRSHEYWGSPLLQGYQSAPR